MQYTNYLLSNIPYLLGITEIAEDESAGFLGVRFKYKDYEWTASVDGYKVDMHLVGGSGVRGLKKNMFTVGKKEETNVKHVEYIKKYMTAILAHSGKLSI